jgi:hypothetical protein
MSLINKLGLTAWVFFSVTAAAELPSFSADLMWENVNTHAGVKRYSFDDKPDLPHNAKIIDGKAYWFLGNGFNRGSSALNSVLAMNLTSGELSEVKGIGKNSLSGNATVSYQGRLFSIGGKANYISHSLNNLVEFDPITSEWQQRNASPLSRYGSQAEVYNNKIYVFGGYGFDSFNEGQVKIGSDGFYYTDVDEKATWRQEVQVYDIASQEWSIVGEAPELPIFWDSTIIDETVYFSAEKDWISSSDIINRYNIANLTWDSIYLPESLVSKKIISVGHLLIVYGLSEFSSVPNSYWKTYIYDTKEQQWFSGATLPNPDETTQVFSLASDQNSLYLFEHSNGRLDSEVKKTYQLSFNISVEPSDNYTPREEQYIESLMLDNGDQLNINIKGDVVNLVIHNQFDYDSILRGDGSTQQKSALKRLTNSVYQKLGDDFQFIYFIFNEQQRVFPNSPYGYHTPVKNDIQGIGQGIFDFTEAYGSGGNLESVVVLSTQTDLIYGPSLHELAHRWGNYLKSPVDSLRQKEWLVWDDSDAYHWGYLSAAGQLGGWRDDFFNGELSNASDNSYMLTDGAEGAVGFSGIGPGNNFAKFSDLELYLMGLNPRESVADLIEPKVKPIETDKYPIHIIEEFNTITITDIINTNGERIPSNIEARKSMSALFVVVSKENISQSDWNNYSHQVNNFTRKGKDDYTRLNNFWEATDGKASMVIPAVKKYFYEPVELNEDNGIFTSFEANDVVPVNFISPYTTKVDGSVDGDLALSWNFSENDVSKRTIETKGQMTQGRLGFAYRSNNSVVIEILINGKPVNNDQQTVTMADGWFYRSIAVDAGYAEIKISFSVSPIADSSFVDLDALSIPMVKPLVAGDFDGDSRAEIAVRNPLNYQNYWKELADTDYNEEQFGRVGNDIPISGDFDGDGKADWAIRRRTNQTWYVKQSSDGEIVSKRFGVQSSDIPVAADYDGDGKTDFAIRRPSNSTWYILQSSDGKLVVKRFGLQRTDVPVPADYDGDGKADIAIRRPSNGTWYVLRSLDNKVEVTRFGVQANDFPVPADYDGDGNADIAVRRAADSTWYILQSSDKEVRKVRFGIQIADIPVVSDYDGDGKADIAVRRSSSYMWFVLLSSSNEVYSEEFGRSATLVPILAPILQRLSMTRNVSAQSKTAESWAFDDGYEDLLQYKETTTSNDLEFSGQSIYEVNETDF